MYIDTRVIKLGKLFVPKTKPFSEFNQSNKTCGSYVSTGYFNYISIYKLSNNNGNHLNSLFEIHQEAEKIINVPEEDECSYQYVKVFTNVDDSSVNNDIAYTKNQIGEFWDDDKLLLFMSMIHIGDSDLAKVVQKINEKLGSTSDKYLIYYTFDYSDIIVFLKSDLITQYMSIISDLNYNLDEKLIEDSYTIYGYNAKKYKELYDMYCDKKFDDINWEGYFKTEKEEEFYASINIGLESKNKLKDLIKEAKSRHRSVKVYRMYGRHDISIVNHKADSGWLLYILMKLDYFSTINDKDENGMILYETFIKKELPKAFEEYTSNCTPSDKKNFYEKVRQELENEFEPLVELLRNNEKLKRYQYPVQEIKNSTLSIIKNNFAEEFVFSMLESFIGLIRHMVSSLKIINSIDDDEDKAEQEHEFDEFVNNYFNSLNCLVSTVMHSDRQFIQATAFNAVFFDVPPKLVAYYSSLLHQLKKIMRANNEKNYSFIFAPNLETGITLRPLSKDKPPVDRVIAISITEESMYNFRSVFRRLAHETAHFAGDDFRFRELRKEGLISIFFYLVFYCQENIDANRFLYETIVEIRKQIKAAGLIDFNNCYSINFKEMEMVLKSSLVLAKTTCKESGGIHRILANELNKYFIKCLEVGDDVKLQKLCNNSFCLEYKKIIDNKGVIGKKYNVDLDVLYKNIADYNTNRFFEIYDEMILNNGIDGFEKTQIVFKTFIDIYTEAFADLQSVIILNLSFVDYLNGFINEEDFNVANMENSLLDLGRIVLVSKLFFDLGIWKDFDPCSVQRPKLNELLELRDIVLYNLGFFEEITNQNSDKIQKVKDQIDSSNFIYLIQDPIQYSFKERAQTNDKINLETLFYPFAILYDYLITCIEGCLNAYNDSKKRELIQSIQDQYEELISFKNIQNILKMMNKSNGEYKQDLFKSKD